MCATVVDKPGEPTIRTLAYDCRRSQIAQLDKTSRGTIRLLVDPRITKIVKDELQRQLEQIGMERAPWQAAFDALGERAIITSKRLLEGGEEAVREGTGEPRGCG